METHELVSHLVELLDIPNITDSSLNGLQIENQGEVRKIALAVDASLAAIEEAADREADMLLVHHGLFWGQAERIQGALYERVYACMQADMALFAAHLPLDLHAELGNNAQLAHLMDWPITDDFGVYHGVTLGKEVLLKKAKALDVIESDLTELLDYEPLVWNFGPKEIQRIGIVSGGGLSMLDEAIEKELDLFITGEPKHEAYWKAEEAGINVAFCGHYATETLGVKAVGDYLEKTFGLETVFLDFPTGL